MNQKQQKEFLADLRAQREKMKMTHAEFGVFFGMERPNYCRLESGGLKTIPRAYPVTLEMLKIVHRAGHTEQLKRRLDALRT